LVVILQGAGPIPGFFESDGKNQGGLAAPLSDHKSFLDSEIAAALSPNPTRAWPCIQGRPNCQALFLPARLNSTIGTCEVFLSEQDLSDLNMRRRTQIQFSCAAIPRRARGRPSFAPGYTSPNHSGLGLSGSAGALCGILFGLVEPVDLVECTRETDVANSEVRIFARIFRYSMTRQLDRPEDQCCQVLSGITPAWVPAQDFAILADCGLEIAFLLIA